MPITTVPTVSALPDPPSIDDASNFEAEADAFLGGLPTWTTGFNAAVSAFNTAIDEFEVLLGTAGYFGTSTTSMAVGLGSKTFTTQTGLSFTESSWVTISDSAAPTANYMHGLVTSYVSATGVMTVSVSTINGSGTKTAWKIALAGPAGPLPTKGTGAGIRGKTNDTDYVTAKALADADAFVTSSNTGSTTLDFSAGRNFQLTLTGNITFNVPSNMTDGQSGAIVFIQDATGSRTLSLNAAIKKPGTAPLLSTAANAVDRLGYMVRGSVLELTALEKALA